MYGWTKGNWTLINAAGKVISVLLPLIFINLCFWKPIYDSSLLFYIFFDFCCTFLLHDFLTGWWLTRLILPLVVVFIGTGAILLFIILVKYIRTGRELKEWDVGTGFGDLDQTSWRKLSFRFDDGTQVTQNVFAQTTGIYDRWLVIRFSIAFVFMMYVLYPKLREPSRMKQVTDTQVFFPPSLFVVNICVIQATGHADILHDSRAAAPDLSAFRAKRNLTLLMPGEIAGPLALVTFGTTKHFRDTLSRTFVPKRWRTPADADVAGQGTINGSICPSFASAAPMTAPMASKVGVGGGAGGGALGRRFGDRGSWTRGVRGLGSTPSVHCMPVPLQDLRSPMFRDSVWRESTLSSIPEYV